MREEQISYFSDGTRVSGIVRTADIPIEGRRPAIIQGPGWLGLKDAKLYHRYHEALTKAGYLVMIFDYRGFGDSDGNTDVISPALQLEDLINGVTYLASRPDVDPDNIGVFGSGGTGGGNAILLAAADKRVRCVVSQVPVADGADWLHRMRSEAEWYSFLERLEKDRHTRVVTGKSELVHPRGEIMVPTPERRSTNVKGDVDGRIPTEVQLKSAEEILAYRPIDVVGLLSPVPLLIIAVENDAVTPTDHAVALYENALPPKKLLMQRNTTHYAAYEQYGEIVVPEIVGWFDSYLTRGSIDTRADGLL
jgi:dipeptidyl aminopeptidase/acylaminoacyl peptidase